MKIKSILFLCILSSSINTAVAFSNENDAGTIASIEKRLATAQKYESDGLLNIALDKTEKLFEESSQHKEVAISYASQLVKTNQAEKAQSIIQPLLIKHTNDWRIWFWLGSSQLLQNDLDNASNSFSEALALNGEEISIWIQKAIVEQEKGNGKAAINLLQVANSLEPNNPDVLVNYAYASESEGEIDNAVKFYRYFLRLSASDRTKGALRSEIMLRLAQIASAQSLVNEDVLNEL